MIDNLLHERGTTHGDFTYNSITSQKLKDVMNDTDNWKHLEPHKKEALQMIAHKIGRILSGNSSFEDHWVDIIGYSQLVIDRIKK